MGAICMGALYMAAHYICMGALCVFWSPHHVSWPFVTPLITYRGPSSLSNQPSVCHVLDEAIDLRSRDLARFLSADEAAAVTRP